MQEIPEWIIKVIGSEAMSCRSCNSNFTINNLISIGIQESSTPPHRDYLCIGFFCMKCKEMIIFELREMTLIDFAFEIIDQETSNEIHKSEDDKKSSLGQFINKKESKIKKSKITVKEIAEAKKFLELKCNTHEDFLIAMGMTPNEIKEYNYKRSGKEK
jgi:hypothetical protein